MDNPGSIKDASQGPWETNEDSRTVKKYRKVGYKASFVSKGSSALETRLAAITNMAEASTRSNNSAWWIQCCSTIVRNIDLQLLGHPQNHVVTIRKLFQANHISNQQEFKDYLLEVLPKNEDGLVLLPEINMEHPGQIKVKIEEGVEHSEVKMEEEKIVEAPSKDKNDELLQSLLAKQSELETKFNDLRVDVAGITFKQDSLALKMKAIQGDLEALWKTEDDRAKQFTKNTQQLDDLKTAVWNARLMMSEVDYKVAVLVEDSKLKGSSVEGQIAAGLKFFSKPDDRSPPS